MRKDSVMQTVCLSKEMRKRLHSTAKKEKKFISEIIIDALNLYFAKSGGEA